MMEDYLLHNRAKELEKTNYKFADPKDKRISDHAVSYMKKFKKRKVFKGTYFTDAETTAEEFESVIYHASILGDINYNKNGKTEHYDWYLNITIRNQLCKYLKERADWEKRHTFIDFENPENDRSGAFGCIHYPTIDITDFDFTGLSDREMQAVLYYAFDLDDDFVGKFLELSVSSIKTYRRRGLEKMRKTNIELSLYKSG